MNSFIINGRSGDNISAMDRGLHYGDGVFETIAYDSGNLLLWPEHLKRLHKGAERLGLSLISEQQWLDDIGQLSFEQPQAVVKLIQTRGVGGRGYYAGKLSSSRIVARYDWPTYPASNGQGVTVRFCQTPVSVNPALAGIKHLNRLDNVLARNEWDDPGIAEGLMLDDRGMVIEGTMSNVFGLKDEVLYTPCLKRAGVKGVLRHEILHLARQQGIVTRCTDISQPQLLAMDELFICNSIIGIWPIIELDTHRWAPGPVTQNFIKILIGEMSGHATKI